MRKSYEQKTNTPTCAANGLQTIAIPLAMCLGQTIEKLYEQERKLQNNASHRDQIQMFHCAFTYEYIFRRRAFFDDQQQQLKPKH